MKPLEQLINTEKAGLLHQLFPDEIPAFLLYMQGVCESIREREQQQRLQWDNGLFSFDFWLSLVTDAEKKLVRYDSRLHKSSSLFADQFFDGYMAVYTVYCLTLYTQTQKHPNRKFTVAIDLLFNP